MSDLEEFEDWSHPSRPITLPRRHRTKHTQWLRLALLAIACLLFWGCWHVGHMIHDAWQVVFP